MIRSDVWHVAGHDVVAVERIALGLARYRLTLACGCTQDATDCPERAKCARHPGVGDGDARRTRVVHGRREYPCSVGVRYNRADRRRLWDAGPLPPAHRDTIPAGARQVCWQQYGAVQRMCEGCAQAAGRFVHSPRGVGAVDWKPLIEAAP